MKSILLLLTFCFLLSCTKDVGLVPENEFECTYGNKFTNLDGSQLKQVGLLPVSINNYWVYADTSWDINGTPVYISVDTVRPVKVQRTGSDTWWFFNKKIPPIYQRNDSAWVLESLWPTGCLNKRLEYYPLGGDTCLIPMIIQGDIGVTRKTFAINHTVTTPAGNFDGCLHFEYMGMRAEIVKRGVGFIRVIRVDMSGNKRQTMTLTGFYIDP